MKLQKDGIAHVLACRMLMNYLNKANVAFDNGEIADLVERMLYNAYSEGAIELKNKIVDLSFEATMSVPQPMGISDLEDSQKNKTLWPPLWSKE